MEKKPESLLVVSWGKTLKGIPTFSSGSQMVRLSSIPVAVAHSENQEARVFVFRTKPTDNGDPHIKHKIPLHKIKSAPIIMFVYMHSNCLLTDIYSSRVITINQCVAITVKVINCRHLL